jgi:hypothetical protein
MASSHNIPTSTRHALQVRPIKPRDAIDVWRLFRQRFGEASPFFFMVIAKHCGAIGVVAERGGEVIGFALANPNARGGVGELLALCASSDADANEIGAALMTGLLQRPAFRRVVALAPARDEVPLAAGVLAALAAAMPAEQGEGEAPAAPRTARTVPAHAS